jgi:trigger factor
MSSTEATDIVITQTNEKPGEKIFKVEVPAERASAAEKKAAAKYAKQAKLPGFRKGKTPEAVIKKKFGAAIRETVVHELVGDGWKAVLDQEDLKPIAEPLVQDLKFEEGEPLIFEVSVAVKPELDLQRLGGFDVVRKTIAVTDEMADAQLEQVRRQHAPWVPVENASPQDGELASITITPLEEEHAEEGSQYQVVIGQGQALPDVEEQLKKMLPDETVEAVVSFPEDFHEESKRGLSRSVKIELHEVKRQDLPDLNDDFARQVGDFDSMEALRTALRSDMETQIRHEADTQVRQQLIDEIVGANSVEAPRPMVQRMLAGIAQNYQIPDEQLEKFTTEMTPMAEQQVKRTLVIDHVAETQGLVASEEDLDAKVEDIAKSRDVQPGQVYASLQKAKQLPEMERGITEEKVFNFLMEQSTITEETA